MLFHRRTYTQAYKDIRVWFLVWLFTICINFPEISVPDSLCKWEGFMQMVLKRQSRKEYHNTEFYEESEGKKLLTRLASDRFH